MDLSDNKTFGFYSKLPIINYKSTDDISGFKSLKSDDIYSENTFLVVADIGKYKDAFIEYTLNEPNVRFAFDYRVLELSRKPSQTIMQGVAKIGGILAFMKLISLSMCYYHKK